MADWETCKSKFLASKMEDYCDTIRLMNSVVASPIEKIALLQCVVVREFVGLFNSYMKSQYQFKQYCADIMFMYIPSDTKVIIECDGHEFHEKTKQQVARDKKRDREFQMAGYKILRYSGSELVNDPVQLRFDLLDVITPNWRGKVDERCILDFTGDIRESNMAERS